MSIEIFYSYSSEDEKYQKKLEKQLSLLRRSGLITDWHSRKIIAGQERADETGKHLDTAAIILLLISPDFMNADYCYSVEMSRAMARYEQGEAKVIPIILRSVHWKEAPFGKLQALPSNSKPVTDPSWHNLDEAFFKVAEGLRNIIEEMLSSSRGIPTIQQQFEVHSSHLWNVPKRNPFFTGREETLTQLFVELQGQKTATIIQPLALSGLGGIGKTQLAVEYVYRHQSEYSTIIWFNAATVEGLRTEYAQLADFLQPTSDNPHNQDSHIMIVKRWFEQKTGWLFIFDNVEDIPSIRHFVPNLQLSNGRVLLTTQARATGDVARCLEIKRLSPNEGKLLLLHRAKIVPTGSSLDQVDKEDSTQADALVAEMDGLPLALEQVGAYIESTSCGLAAYLTLYQDHRKKLLETQSALALDPAKTVATTLSLSFQRIERTNPAAADLLRVCSFLEPDVIPLEFITRGAHKLAGTLKSISHDQILLDEAIQVIFRYSLIQRDSKKNMLNIHRLVQAVIQDNMDRKTQRRWVKRIIETLNCIFPPSGPTTWSLCQRLLWQALACAKLIDKYTFTSTVAIDLLQKIVDHLSEMKLAVEEESLRFQLWKMSEKVLGEEHHDTCNILHGLAWCCFRGGKFEQAESLYSHLLAILQRVEPEPFLFTGHILHNLGWIATSQKRYAQAESFYLQSLDISKQAPEAERWRLAHSLWPLARLYVLQQKYEEAAPFYEQSLEIYEELCKKDLEHGAEIPSVIKGLAELYYRRGEHTQIEALLQRALTITEQLGASFPYLTDMYCSLAEIYSWRDEYTQVDSLLQKSLRVAEQRWGTEHPYLLDILLQFTQFYSNVNDHEKMEILSQRAVSIREQLLRSLPQSQYLNIVQAYQEQAEVYNKLNMFDKAEPWYLKALATHEQALGQEHIDTISSLHQLAWCYTNQSKYDQAKPFIERALMLREQVRGHEHPEVAQSYMTLGWFYVRQAEWEKARPFLQRALQIYTKISDDECVAECASYLGDVYTGLDEYEEAEIMYNRALHCWKQVKDFNAPEIVLTLSALVYSYDCQGKYKQAEPLFEQLLALDPTQAKASLDRGYIYLRLMEKEHAYKCFASYASLYPKSVNAAWMVIWAALGKQPPGIEIAERLETIALFDPQSDEAYTCRGVALGLRGKWQEGLTELEQALHIKSNSEDAWFWKGMACAYLEYDATAVESIEQAVQNSLPPLLLTPLFWLEQDRPQFYQEYGEALLKRYELL